MNSDENFTQNWEGWQLLPWSRRRVKIARKIASRGQGGMPVNIKHTTKTNTREPDSRDLSRFISQGYARLTHKSSRPRSRPFSQPPGKQYKTVILTNKGWALIGEDHL